MKRLTAFIVVFSLILFTFCACSKKDKFELGEEATVTQIQNGNKKEQAHLTDNGYVNKMDHFDSKGNPVYSEEYVYDDEGSVTDYIYRDNDGNFLARYNPATSKFFNENKKEITENDFMKMLDELGANK